MPYLLDIKSLSYLIDWFPGAGFKRHAKEWTGHSVALVNEPFEDVKRSWVGFVLDRL